MFIERANKIHKEKYDYSLVEYKNAKTKVIIICPTHGEFLQTPDNHLQGSGCQKCAGNIAYSIEELINKFKSVHDNKYQYNHVVYNGIFSKIKIHCPTHGYFEQIAKSHIDGKGCPKCAGKNLSQEEHIFLLNSLHNNLYDYSKSVFKKAKDKVKIICKTHGEFLQTLDSHKKGSGCAKCKNSKGEKLIREFLQNKNIEHEIQKTFDVCRNYKTGKLLLFDFYLPSHNICIEYDGEQHFKSIRFSKNNKITLKEIKFRDEIKNNFCKNNDIKLIRINYKNISKIHELLNRHFSD